MQKSNTYFRNALLLLMVATIPLVSLGSIAKELNFVDDQGRKQGHWIIKGYMLNSDTYAPNATVEEGMYEDNLKDGLWTRYFPNGVIKSEIFYERNRPRGEYKIYHENGQLEEHGYWNRNKNIGDFKRFYANGNPQQDFFFSDNGLRFGTQKYYHENGNLWLEVNVVNGKEEGEMKRYFPDGKLKERKVFHNGELDPSSVRTYGGNTPKAEQPIVTTTPTPISQPVVVEEPTPPAEGSTTKESTFKLDGFNTLYNENQQITQVGEFKEGRIWNGKWHRYNQNGALIRIEVYMNGKYVGNGLMEKK